MPTFKRPNDGVIFLVLEQYEDTIARLRADGWQELSPAAPSSPPTETAPATPGDLERSTEAQEPAGDPEEHAPVVMNKRAKRQAEDAAAKQFQARNDNARAWIERKY